MIPELIWIKDSAHSQHKKAGAAGSSRRNLFSIVGVGVDPEITEPEELNSTRDAGHEKGEGLGK